MIKLLQACPTTCIVALTVLMSCLPASHAQTVSTSPVEGIWSWRLFNGQCTETLQYRADGVLLNTSGQAVTEWRYAASTVPDAEGFYRISEISTRHNSKKDCSDDVVDENGLEATKFIQLNPAKDQMIICKTPSLQACYGPLMRLP